MYNVSSFLTCYVNIIFQSFRHLPCLLQININVIGVMTDEELGQYIVRYGARLALRAFCRQRTVITEKSRGAESKRQARGTTENSCQQRHRRLQYCWHAVKTTRRVEMRWLHFDKSTYHQIKTTNGQHLSVQKSVTMGELVETGVFSKWIFIQRASGRLRV